MTVEVRRILENEDQIFKSLREKAFIDSPEYFYCILDDYSLLDANFWKAQTITNATSFHRAMFIAIEDNEPKGFILLSKEGECSWISMIWIDSSMRGKKVSDLLMKKAARWSFDEAKTYQMKLLVKKTNKAALSFYQKQGWSQDHDEELILSFTL